MLLDGETLVQKAVIHGNAYPRTSSRTRGAIMEFCTILESPIIGSGCKYHLAGAESIGPLLPMDTVRDPRKTHPVKA